MTGTMPSNVARASVTIGPSILSADFLHLGRDVERAEAAGADYLHFDVMDGMFVPNISIGLPVLTALRAGTRLPIDVHLMIVEPERWVEAFVEAGADSVTVQVEASTHLHRAVEAITAAGAEAGAALNPATPLAHIEEILPFLDQVLVMTVNPGFGGQTFIREMVDKIGRLRKLIDAEHPACRLQVDGGINADTIRAVVEAGADTIVAGSAIYNDQLSVEDALRALRAAITDI